MKEIVYDRATMLSDAVTFYERIGMKRYPTSFRPRTDSA